MTFLVWWCWCDVIGESVYDLLLHLHRHSPEEAYAIERGFDDEFARLYLEGDFDL